MISKSKMAKIIYCKVKKMYLFVIHYINLFNLKWSRIKIKLNLMELICFEKKME